MQELLRIAGRMGLRVHMAHLDDEPNLLGYYNHENRVIILRMSLTPFELRSVLAHEISHAFYGDECSDGPQERRAERHAAAMLISPEAYAAAERLDPHPAAIADELHVTQDIVETYQQQCLQRLGERTYGRSWRVGLAGALARHLSS